MVERHLRIPAGVWAWQGTVLVVTVLALPTLVALWLQPGARTVSDAATILGLAAPPAKLAAAIMLYVAWRLTCDHVLAWLAAAFTASAIKGGSFVALRLTHGAALDDYTSVLLFFDLLFVATVATALTLWRRTPPPVDPVVIGFGFGILVSALRLGLIEGNAAALPGWTTDLALVLLAGAYAMLAVTVARLLGHVPWARTRLTAAVLLFGCNRLATYGAPDDAFASTVDLVTEGLGTVLLCTVALSMLWLSIRESTSTVSELHDRVERVEARSRLDRERLHEINATLAGIVAASRLIHENGIDQERRAHLERMVESELARLAAMLDPGGSPIRTVDLDEALEPVVTAQRVLGRSVDWSPSGHHVTGRSEDIAEIVTTLLENAAQHAPGSPVWVACREVDDEVELTVSDVGPGIPPEVGDRIFDWGECGPGSQGQGIGLCVAKRLAEEMGGSLTWAPTNGVGAVFVLRLKLARTPHGAANRHA